jgi:hypothetical protein
MFKRSGYVAAVLAAILSSAAAETLTAAQVEALGHCDGMSRCIQRVAQDPQAAIDLNACANALKNPMLGLINGNVAACKEAANRRKYTPLQQAQFLTVCGAVHSKNPKADRGMCDRLLAGLPAVPVQAAPQAPPAPQTPRSVQQARTQ